MFAATWRQSDMNADVRVSRLVAGFGVAALIGLGVFGLFAWRSVTVQHAPPNEALRRFTEIRNALAGLEPIVSVNAEGRFVRRGAPDSEPRQIKLLRVLAYRTGEQRLVRANIPFWFVSAKGPAVQWSLRGTGFDLNRLGLTASDLKRYGPTLVFDETRENGDRLLVWTE